MPTATRCLPSCEAAVAEGRAGLEYFNAAPQRGAGEPIAAARDRRGGQERRPAAATSRSADGSPRGRPLLPGLLRAQAAVVDRASRHGGNGPTAFHQDFITFAVDRSGGMTFWFPLEAYGPTRGRCRSSTARTAPGCSATTRPTAAVDALDAFPELRDLEMAEPMAYELGDITVHTHLTIHGAGSEPDGPAPVGVHRGDPAGGRLLERLAVPELRLGPPWHRGSR